MPKDSVVSLIEYKAKRNSTELVHTVEPIGATRVRIVIDVDEHLELKWELSGQDVRNLIRALGRAKGERRTVKLTQAVTKAAVNRR